MNIATILIALAIALGLFFAVRSLVKNRGSGCSGCSGDCADCHKRK